MFESESVPSGSVAVDVNVTWSPVLGASGAELKPAVGGWLATSIAREATSVAPLSSVTRSLTVCDPGVAKLVLAVELVPSSKTPSLFRSHAYEAIEPSGSVELDVKVTSRRSSAWRG